MTGVNFLKEVREQWPEIVRIVISGYTDSEDIIAGINEAGIYQYILKPWSPDHLLEAVRNAVEAQALQQQTSRLDLELRTSTRVLRQRTASQMAQARSSFGLRPHRARAGQPAGPGVRDGRARGALRHPGDGARRVRQWQGAAGARHPLRLAAPVGAVRARELCRHPRHPARI